MSKHLVRWKFYRSIFSHHRYPIERSEEKIFSKHTTCLWLKYFVLPKTFLENTSMCQTNQLPISIISIECPFARESSHANAIYKISIFAIFILNGQHLTHWMHYQHSKISIHVFWFGKGISKYCCHNVALQKREVVKLSILQAIVLELWECELCHLSKWSNPP